LPPDEQLALLSYDLELLIEAVYERRSADRSYYLSPDEILVLRANREWQSQCAIAEHIVDYALDYSKIPQNLR